MATSCSSLIAQEPAHLLDTHSTPAAAPSQATLTQQPFGDTEKPLSPDDALGPVEFLDLNAAPRDGDEDSGGADSKGSISTPSSMLDAAASLLPTMPFISGTDPSGNESHIPPNHPMKTQTAQGMPAQSRANTPPNPLTAKPGETAEMPLMDDRLSSVPSPEAHSDDPTDALPKVCPGEGDGPNVIYRKDIVLDTAGYHRADRKAAEVLPNDLREQGEKPTTSDVRESVLDSFTRDLEAAISSRHRPTLHLRSTDSDVQAHTERLARSSDPDIPLATHTSSLARSDRATSEPPPEPPVPLSPTLDPSSTALAMDYAWDWGRLPSGSDPESAFQTPTRRETLPPLEIAAETASSVHVKGVEENPYLFVLEMEGRSHTFELAFCATIIDDPLQSTQARESAFLDNRISFQRFVEEPQIVDDSSLVLRYSLQ